MQQRDRTMKTLNSTEAQEQFQHILREVREGTIRALIEEDGRLVAALVSVADLQQLERNEDFAIFEEISQVYKDEPLEKIEQEVAKAVREAREERRGEPPTTSSAP
jgi:prevent-host-death family protein